MLTDTQQRVIKTLELFALQSTALTLMEVWRFLVRDSSELAQHMSGRGELVEVPELENRMVSMAEVKTVLDYAVTTGHVVQEQGYYSLSTKPDLPKRRWLGYQAGVWREKRIRRFIKILPYVPFVRGVALAGSQALGLERDESDIDLLVITTPGWLWLPRTLVTAYFHMFGVRRYDAYIANRFCLNHYIAGAKQMRSGRNWYTAIEYAKLRPLQGKEAIQKFQEVNEQWIQAFFPNFTAANAVKFGAPGVQRILERMFSWQWLEHVLGKWQSERIHKNEPHIIVAEDELSFHPESKQDGLLKAF